MIQKSFFVGAKKIGDVLAGRRSRQVRISAGVVPVHANSLFSNLSSSLPSTLYDTIDRLLTDPKAQSRGSQRYAPMFRRVDGNAPVATVRVVAANSECQVRFGNSEAAAKYSREATVHGPCADGANDGPRHGWLSISVPARPERSHIRFTKIRSIKMTDAQALSGHSPFAELRRVLFANAAPAKTC